MRLLISLAFLCSAVGLGAYAYFPGVGTLDSLTIAGPALQAGRPSAGAMTTASTPPATADSLKFAPERPFMRRMIDAISVPADRASAGGVDETPGSTRAHAPASGGGTTAAVDATNAWRTNVTVAAADQSSRRTTAPELHDKAHYELVRNLQTEMKRVGCYDGNIDSDWGPASKRAIANFLEKVNATLPYERPDYILLTLLQGHSGGACSLACPSGQTVASDGRCLPSAIVAQATESGHRRVARGETAQAPATPQNAGPGTRIAAGGSSDWQTATIAPATTSATEVVVPVPRRVPQSARAVAMAAKAEAETAAKAQAARAQVTRVEAGRVDAARAEIADRVARAKQAEAARALAIARAPLPAPAAAAEVASAQAPSISPPAEPLPGRMAVGAPPPTSEVLAATLATEGVGIALPPTSTAAMPATAAPDTTTATQPDAAESNRSRPARRSHASRRHAPSADRPRREGRPEPVRTSRQERSGSGSVRTYVGKVRRGSPQHNLMLSLGGVF